MRSTCSVFCGLSLDGFIARPDGALDFLEGDGTAEMGDHGYEAFMAGIDALVMGRRTFEVVMGFEAWPYVKKSSCSAARPSTYRLRLTVVPMWSC